MRRNQVCRLRQLVFLALGAWTLMPGAACAQQAGGGRELLPRQQNDLFDLEIEELVDQLALPKGEVLAQELRRMGYSLGDTEPMRRRLETRLKTRIDHVDRACKLTPEQKVKLNVAGRGDLKRVFARMDELSELLTAPVQEVRRRKELLLEFARKRQEIKETDIFGDDSLFAKVLKSTLTKVQHAVRDQAAKQAAIAQHKATIRWAVGSLDTWLKLSPEQHEKLETLLATQTRSPQKFGEYDYYGLLFQASKLPDKELKAIFDEDQWRKIERQFVEARRLEKILRGGGFLPADDMADAGKSQRTEPGSESDQPRC